MFKKIFVLFFMFSAMTFSLVRDEIGFFSEQEEKEINERVQLLEKQFDINFQINLILEDSFNENLNNLEKTVIINLLKTDERVLKLNLMFSSDLEVSEYKDDINELLSNLELLIVNGEYQDFIYELTANVSDIINLVTIEDKKIESRMQAIKLLKGFGVLLFSLISVLIVVVLGHYLVKKVKQKNNTNFCSKCNVRMRIFDKIEKKDKVIKIYKCSKCGETKQIIMKKR
jgi:hypothetical protein